MAREKRVMRRDPHYGTPPEEREDWVQRTRIQLTPIAAPAVLGLFAFGGATWPVAAHLAGWYGGHDANAYLWEFGALFGGGGQLIAAIWSSRARHALGTGPFGMWGFWWLAWGLMVALDATGVLPLPKSAVFEPFGFWFITTGIITLFGMIAALRVNLGVVAVMFCAGTASLIVAAGKFVGSTALVHAGGADFFAAATFAVYTGAAIMLEEIWGHPVLWVGTTKLSRSPSMAPKFPIEYEHGMPGSRIG